ncbi:hypothetical protein ACFR9U_20930 [Halorientalis brevis]|uniref:Major facilitator superfamily (MFS) profile domain-containing protein n=1 Tax=Halorientalis brevis TaxID=1126241 RepID=A0ABD6CJ44_9EURY|nr:hypothetical protein [Halorientalis brevis]
MVTLWRREIARRTVGFVLGSSVVLTASFVGVLGLASGELTDSLSRLPFYSLGLAVVFVTAIVGLIRYDADGITAMLGAIGIAIVGFVLVALTGEGLLYALRFPGRVFGSQLLLYFFAAGLIGTGLGYWLLSFWREFASEPEG